MTSKEAIDRLKRGIDGLDDLGAGSKEWKEEFDAIEQELELLQVFKKIIVVENNSNVLNIKLKHSDLTDYEISLLEDLE